MSFKILLYFLLLFSLYQTQIITAKEMSDTTITKWEIRPSFKYDALCFLNILTGDTFYLGYYKDVYEKFKDKIDDKTRGALSDLKKRLKDEKGVIISASLCLYFSAADDSTLEQMMARLDKLDELKNNFMKTPYYDEESWQLFLSVKDNLKIIFSFLKRIDFPSHWEKNILPVVNKYVNDTKDGLPNYDVVKLNEHYLGYKLPSDVITVYVLYYAQPHGIKITGMRFLTDVAWPFKIVIRTSAHEMMHPPYNLSEDTELKKLIDSFGKDDFVMDKVNNHNPSFGYNSLEGLFEEDCVQALDQLISEKLDVAKDARKRWIESDDGIHVIAVALYQIMKEENYNDNNEVFRDFLIRINSSGKFVPGKIKEYFDKFYN